VYIYIYIYIYIYTFIYILCILSYSQFTNSNHNQSFSWSFQLCLLLNRVLISLARVVCHGQTYCTENYSRLNDMVRAQNGNVYSTQHRFSSLGECSSCPNPSSINDNNRWGWVHIYQPGRFYISFWATSITKLQVFFHEKQKNILERHVYAL
jgi:hypothetical protein